MTLFSSLWSEANGTNTPLFGDLWAGVSDTGVEALEPLFANGELGGYWPADPVYAYEDSAGTTAASVNGVVGYRTDVALGKHAVQATTANKPYLRRTPTTGKPWYDSNTATGALNVTFASAIGRRNLLTYTEDFRNAKYTALLSSVVANQSVSPDGTLSADYFKEDNTTGIHQCFYSITVTANSTYVFSVFAKHGGRQIRFANDTGGKVSIFDLSNGTVVSGDNASIVDAGGGWYRCCHSFTPTSTSGVTYITLFSGGAYNYAGDNVSGIYLWGAQLEVGTTPTDYQKIVAGPSAVLDHAALAATYPQNITASTNCTIACVTPEGVVIADNQTVGTTYNITPPYGYNSDVLIINRALTPAEKALVTRVMQRNVPQLGSELVTNGNLENGTTGWTAGNNGILSVVNGKLSIVNGATDYGRATHNISTSLGKRYVYKFSFTKIAASGLTSLGTTGTGGGINDVFQVYSSTSLSMSAMFAALSSTTYIRLANLHNDLNNQVFFDDISVKEIL